MACRQWLLFIVIAVVCATADAVNPSCRIQFKLINGSLCTKSQFIESASNVRSELQCSLLCAKRQLCQAFSTADGPCQLFVFHRCSKAVRDCGCSRRGRVFVKQQPGLQPGSLCPSDYGDELCGVKYKMYLSVGNWFAGRQRCESESGLVIMADVISATEMNHVDNLYTKYGNGVSVWLGGYQADGSAEPKGGWYWVGCNITLDGSLWYPGEPDNWGTAGESAVVRFYSQTRLTDVAYNWASNLGVLCECVSPF